MTRLALHSAGLVTPARRRGKHRRKRQPSDAGNAVFQDGSTHRWIGALGHDLDLIVTLDDATNWIYSAILVDEEGTMSSFLGLRETIAAHGVFGALYTDRGSHYFVTPKAGGKVDKRHLTQVGRALGQLGVPPHSIEHKTKLIRDWFTKRPRWHPHFTPTTASWIN